MPIPETHRSTNRNTPHPPAARNKLSIPTTETRTWTTGPRYLRRMAPGDEAPVLLSNSNHKYEQFHLLSLAAARCPPLPSEGHSITTCACRSQFQGLRVIPQFRVIRLKFLNLETAPHMCVCPYVAHHIPQCVWPDTVVKTTRT
jgi:hypothetical protein